MCKLKSAIILKDRVFVPDYDSHTDMLKELGIEDTRANAKRLFVRAELIPTNGDVFSNISGWNFNVDQDILPEWFVAEYEKQRMIEAVKSWALGRIHVGKGGLTITEGKMQYIKDCEDVTGSNSTVKAWGNSTVVKNEWSSFKKERLVLCENATFKDCKEKVIYQSGDWKFVTVKGDE